MWGLKDPLLFRNQRKVKRKAEQHQIEALYEDAIQLIKQE